MKRSWILAQQRLSDAELEGNGCGKRVGQLAYR